MPVHSWQGFVKCYVLYSQKLPSTLAVMLLGVRMILDCLLRHFSHTWCSRCLKCERLFWWCQWHPGKETSQIQTQSLAVGGEEGCQGQTGRDSDGNGSPVWKGLWFKGSNGRRVWACRAAADGTKAETWAQWDVIKVPEGKSGTGGYKERGEGERKRESEWESRAGKCVCLMKQAYCVTWGSGNLHTLNQFLQL